MPRSPRLSTWLWADRAAETVADHAHQVFGALGFCTETGLVTLTSQMTWYRLTAAARGDQVGDRTTGATGRDASVQGHERLRDGVTRALILSGGPFHDFDTTSRMLSELLALEGISSDNCDDVEQGLADAPAYDLLVVNMLRWRMLGEWFDDDRDEWAMSLSAQGREAFHGHLAKGRGILALHTATICFDDWAAWATSSAPTGTGSAPTTRRRGRPPSR